MISNTRHLDATFSAERRMLRRWAICLWCLASCGLCGITSGVSISIVNDEIQCDGLRCPVGSLTCRVTQNTNSDLSMIVISRQCKQQNGIIVAQQGASIPNVGGQQISSVSETSAATSITKRTSPTWALADDDGNVQAPFWSDGFNWPFYVNAVSADPYGDIDDNDVFDQQPFLSNSFFSYLA